MALWRSWLARRPVTAEVAGSSPVRVADQGAYPEGWALFPRQTENSFGPVAQLVERSTENRKVTGSTPVGTTEPSRSFYIAGTLLFSAVGTATDSSVIPVIFYGPRCQTSAILTKRQRTPISRTTITEIEDCECSVSAKSAL